MSPRKLYFDEPIVRAEVSRARFPRVCPVCGRHATTTSHLTIVSGRRQYLRREWDPYFDPLVRKRQRAPQPSLKVLPIHVCADHYYTDEGENRYKSLCLIIDGLAMALMFFGLLFLGDSVSRGRIISPWVSIFTVIFSVSLLVTFVVFRPNALVRAVKIVGFDAGMQNVLLFFKSPTYREEFVKENPLDSELVSWVVKADT